MREERSTTTQPARASYQGTPSPPVKTTTVFHFFWKSQGPCSFLLCRVAALVLYMRLRIFGAPEPYQRAAHQDSHSAQFRAPVLRAYRRRIPTALRTACTCFARAFTFARCARRASALAWSFMAYTGARGRCSLAKAGLPLAKKGVALPTQVALFSPAPPTCHYSRHVNKRA